MQTNVTVEDINMNTYNYCHLKVTKIQKQTSSIIDNFIIDKYTIYIYNIYKIEFEPKFIVLQKN